MITKLERQYLTPLTAYPGAKSSILARFPTLMEIDYEIMTSYSGNSCTIREWNQASGVRLVHYT